MAYDPKQAGATRKLAAFTASLKYAELPATSVEAAKRFLLDHLGVAIGGSQTRPAGLIRQVVLKGAAQEATVLDGKRVKTTALEAAFCNASASHCLDFDDLHNPSIIHLACVTVAPALAVAEAERVSGAELLTALCAGYEAGARAGESVIPESYFYWHTTGTAGIFGGAAACAHLLGLDPQQTLMCYGSAGTQAAGLWEFLKEGSMSKVLHAGKSSYGAVLAAYLSRAGFTAASEILEGEKGFCRAMLAQPHLEKLTAGLDVGHLKIEDNSYKPYPCCKHSHAALYGVESLCAEYGVGEKDVAAVKIYVNDITDYLINNPEPQTAYGYKFSLQYCAAAMLRWGRVGVDSFSPEAVADPAVRQLMARVTLIRDKEQQAVYEADPAKLASKVELVLQDGRVLSKQVDYPKGDPQNMMTWPEAEAKFKGLVDPVYGSAVADRLYQWVRQLDACPDVAAGLAEALG